ncbi:MAG TPA: TIR domain-containing protein [Armatimonadota bacterium]|nr:TIR domain-containing protein [Armatimonadota bacterium]
MKQSGIYVIQPFKEEYERVFALVASAAAKVGVPASNAASWPLQTGDIMGRIHEAIRTADLLIADASNANPNVMYEIGFAQAENKPLIYIASSSRVVPFDLAGYRFLIYDLVSPTEFVDRLANAIQQALNEPQAFTLPRISAERDKRQNVFISYSHHDREYLDRLLVHLKPLEREGLVDLWVDTRLKAGDRWKKEIEKALNRATVAILLVSADFLASDFITGNELPPILRNAEETGTRIVPVIVKPCRFMRDKSLRHFQAINDPKESLILLNPGEQEVYYDLVAAEVEKTLQRG